MSNNKFYKNAKADILENGYGVFLDGRRLVTPAKKPLIVSTIASAQLIADEWNAQDKIIDTNTMPITRLVNVAIDRAPLTRDALCEEVAKYASTDLICYRTSAPEILYKKQCELWDCELEWFAQKFGISLIGKSDSFEKFQSSENLAKIQNLASEYDDLCLTILAFVTALAGSAILGFAMLNKHLSDNEVFTKIRIEEDHNAAIWGYDDEDLSKANARLSDLNAAYKLICAL
jgi:chaperone required for assembly of F1-ATPase